MTMLHQVLQKAWIMMIVKVTVLVQSHVVKESTVQSHVVTDSTVKSHVVKESTVQSHVVKESTVARRQRVDSPVARRQRVDSPVARRRWLFFLVWLAKNPNWNINKHYRRRLYLKELGNELVSGHLQRRLETPQALQAGVRRAMIDIGLLPSRPTANTRPPPATGKRRCQICPRMEDKKVITRCVYCEIHCCPRHHSIICDVCQADI